MHELRKQNNIVAFLSQTMWNPVPNTWIQAIKAGLFSAWPGLTENLVTNDYEITPETEKGHIKTDRKM